MKRALVILLLVGAVARADDREAAKRAFVEGNRLYDIADYRAALEAFKKAYLNYEDPTLLFNIAQCYRQLDDKAEAIRFYRTYIRKSPRAPNIEEARRLVASLEAAQAAAKPAHEPASSPSASSPPPSSPVVRAPAPSPAPAVAAAPRPQPKSTAAPPLVVTAAPAPVEQRPVYKKWWFWTATVLAAGVVATAIGVGVVEGRPREPSYRVNAP